MVALASRALLTLAMVLVAVALNVLTHHANKNFLIFSAIVTVFTVQLHLLFYGRIVSPFAAKPVVFAVAKRLYLVFCGATYTGPLLARVMPGSLLAEVGLACFICNIWLLFFCGVFSLARLLSSRVQSWSRQREAVVLVGLLLLFAGAATYEARLEYEVNHVSVRLGLPHPLTITLVSDLHLGPVLGGDFCARVAATVRRLDSDLVFLVGDIFDTSFDKLSEAATRCVTSFHNRKGLFYVTGNHGEQNGVLYSASHV